MPTYMTRLRLLLVASLIALPLLAHAGDTVLRYHADAGIGELQLGECVVRRFTAGPISGWRLWFKVLRDSDGQPDTFSVRVNPGGNPEDGSVDSRMWGLRRVGVGRWQINPSIDVVGRWHHTPEIVGVPEPPPWERR